MSFFKNKHVVTAMIVTPILAVLGYYLTDLVVKESPRAAVQGQSYALVAKSNCRFTSGECDLENANFKSTLTIDSEGDTQVLKLKASHQLEGVTVGFIENNINNGTAPTKMVPSDDDYRLWSLPMPVVANENTVLRIALMANGSHYFSETTLGFGEYKTSFSKNF